MKTRDKIIFTTLLFFGFFAMLYMVRSILTPFIFSIVIAYFLNPVVERFYKKYHLSRLRATSLILGLFFATLISSGLLIFPVIYSQMVDFIDSVPGYLRTFSTDFYPKILAVMVKLGFVAEENFSSGAIREQIVQRALTFSRDFVGNAINSSSVIIDILTIVFIMPILLFYFLKDWSLIIQRINEYLPKNYATPIRKVFVDIDKTMSGYIRGQFNVCLMLGIIYSILLSCTGLNFGFLIGFVTGMLVFIPYIGMLIGVTTGIIVALFQWGFDPRNIGLVSLVFLAGQIIESNFLTPKLVGSKVGLHPMWLIFGLFFFGILFGFLGILFAVPLTAISGVVIKHLAAEYKKRFV